MENNQLTGKVKFYNKDKGYGFIYCEETDKDYHFHIKNVNKGAVPSANDVVTFEPKETSEGLSALSVTITSKGETTDSSTSDSRVKCPSCGKSMVPRVVFNNGMPSYSICPFCGSKYKKFNSGCLGIIIFGIIAIFIFFMFG